MLTLSEGLKIAVEHDYEKNEVLGIIRKDNISILMTRFLLDRKEVLEIVDNLTKSEQDDLGEIV